MYAASKLIVPASSKGGGRHVSSCADVGPGDARGDRRRSRLDKCEVFVLVSRFGDGSHGFLLLVLCVVSFSFVIFLCVSGL